MMTCSSVPATAVTCTGKRSRRSCAGRAARRTTPGRSALSTRACTTGSCSGSVRCAVAAGTVSRAGRRVRGGRRQRTPRSARPGRDHFRVITYHPFGLFTLLTGTDHDGDLRVVDNGRPSRSGGEHLRWSLSGGEPTGALAGPGRKPLALPFAYGSTTPGDEDRPSRWGLEGRCAPGAGAPDPVRVTQHVRFVGARRLVARAPSRVNGQPGRHAATRRFRGHPH
jgi:hypothetical protein